MYQARHVRLPEYQKLSFAIFDIYQRQGRHFELLLKAKLQELIYLLYFHQYVLRKHSDDMYRKMRKFRELIDYIHQHYQEKLSIISLADIIGYSKTHFMTVFKTTYWNLLHRFFIIQFRLSKARDLLVNSIKPILEVASEVGFTNLSNFNRQFKRYYQITPSQYRKQFKRHKNSKIWRP